MKKKEARTTLGDLWEDWSKFSSKHPILSEWMILSLLLVVFMQALARITGKQWDLV